MSLRVSTRHRWPPYCKQSHTLPYLAIDIMCMMVTILHCLALWESTQHCWPPCCKQSHIICTMLQCHTIHTLPCCITFHLDWLLDITGCLIARYCFHSRKLLETIPVAKRSRCDPHIFSFSKKTCYSPIPFLLHSNNTVLFTKRYGRDEFIDFSMISF